MTRIMVVAFLRAAREHVGDVARAVEEQLGRGGSVVPGRVDAYAFESLDDATCLLYVGRWKSREVLDAYRRRAPHPGPVDWYTQIPTVEVYEPLATYVEMYAPSEAASLLLLDGPPEGAPAVREYLLTYARGVPARELGGVEYEFGQHPDRTGHFVAFARWRTLADRNAYRAGPGARFVDELRALGCTVSRFDGHRRAATVWETPS